MPPRLPLSPQAKRDMTKPGLIGSLIMMRLSSGEHSSGDGKCGAAAARLRKCTSGVRSVRSAAAAALRRGLGVMRGLPLNRWMSLRLHHRPRGGEEKANEDWQQVKNKVGIRRSGNSEGISLCETGEGLSC